MDEFLKEIIMISVSYVAVIAIGFGVINWLSQGFLTKFVRVRASRGKLVLLKVVSSTDIYFRTGKISEKSLRYKARNQKEEKLVPVPDNILYNSMGVWCLDIEEDSNAVINKKGEKIESYDAEKYEQLFIRALYKPALMDRNEKIILIMLAVAILGLFIVFFYVRQTDQNIFLMKEQLAALKQITSSSIAVVG